MPSKNAKVGRRTDRETYLTLNFQMEFEAKRVYRVLDSVAAAGKLDPKSYLVVCVCPTHGYELILVLAIGTDHDAQIAAVVEACQRQLGLTIQCREMRPQDYEPHALLARLAKSQEN